MSPLVQSPLRIEHALLGLLRDAPCHAYDMHQRLQQAKALGFVWNLKQSHLYALLTKLEAAGFITATPQPQPRRPPRRLLQLTEEGRQAFQTWLATPVEHGRDFRLEFLAKLYFAQQDSQETTALLVQTQQQACQQWLERLRHQAAQLHDQPYEWLVIRFRVGQIEAIVSWLDVCMLAPSRTQKDERLAS